MKIHVLTVAGVLCASVSAMGATTVATYDFDGGFAAIQGGVPALTAIDPLGTSNFHTDSVLGENRQVWQFNGSGSPATNEAGLTLNTTGLVSPESYSVDMVLEFFDRNLAYRRLLDVQNRQSDNGLYVDPSNNLNLFPISGSTAAWSNNIYHHLVMTDNGTTVSVYLDGISQFSANSAEMNLDFDGTNNPNKLLGFFVDNIAAGGQGEWSAGNVALVRVWDGVLTASEAQQLANNPFAGVPEPASVGLLGLGAVVGLRRRRR